MIQQHKKSVGFNFKDFFLGSIRKKLLLGFFVVVIIPSIAFGYVDFVFSSKSLIHSSILRLVEDVDIHERHIKSFLRGFEEDIIFFSKLPPIQGIIRAREGQGLSLVDNSTYLQWTNRLGLIFKEAASSKKRYMQIRYLDEDGNELVRVDSDGNITKRITDENLQNKRDRYYFNETMKLSEGEIFISSLDLNKEGNPPEIEIPHNPTVRYATPVFSHDGERRGIVIMNVFASIFFDTFLRDEHQEQVGSSFLVDQDGFYLFHFNDEKRWGGPSNLDTGESVINELPENMSKLILSGSSGAINMQEHKHIFAYKTIPLLSSMKETQEEVRRVWVVFDIISHDVALASVIQLRNNMFFVSIIVIFLALLFSYIISRFISIPIEKLRIGVRNIEAGNFNYKVGTRAQDEIGALGRVFDKMALSIKNSQDILRQQVSEQTQKIRKQKDDIELQQVATLNVLEDVNLQKERIAIEEERVSTILRSIGDGLFVLNKELKINTINAAGLAMSGFSAEEVIGKKYGEVFEFIDERGNNLDEFLRDPMITGNVRVMPNGLILKTKKRKGFFVEGSASPLKDKSGGVVGCIVVFRDISEKIRIEKSKSEFVSIASHQLRTPMTGIKWVIERFLKKEKGLTKQGKEYLKDLHTSVTKLAELVDSLLNVSRIESGEGIAVIPEKVDLVEFMKSYLGELAPLVAKKNLKLTFSEHPDVLEITTDPRVLRNIIQSIISNAIEYTPIGGKIDVSLESKENFIMIKIKDNGIGIPEKDQESIFDKFSRASNAVLAKTDGTGLGLYIAKSAAELLAGKIRFQSEENKGTTFYIELPHKVKSKEGSKIFL